MLWLALQADGWVEKLGAESIEERTEAFARLREMGDRAEPALRRRPENPYARSLLQRIDLSRRIPPRIVTAVPAVLDRLASGDEHEWTLVLLELRWGESAPDLEFLADRALLGVRIVREARDVIETLLRNDIPVASSVVQPWIPSRDIEVRVGAARLWAGGDIDRVRSLLRDPDPLRCLAGVEIAGPELAGEILRLLEDDDPSILEAAANCCRRWRLAAAHARLVPLLERPEWRVRERAVEAVAAIADPRAADALAPLLRDEMDEVRLAVVRGLTQLQAVRAAPGIRLLLNDPDPYVRSAALRALDSFPDSRSEPDMIERLRDEIPFVRRQALEALAAMGAHDAAPSMLPLLDDPDDSVRRSAVWALVELKRPGLPEILRRRMDAEERGPMLRTLLSGWVELQDPASRESGLRELLARGHCELREAALKEMGDRSFVTADDLRRALRDLEPSLRNAAAWVIGRRGWRELWREVRDLLSDPDVRTMAIGALQELGVREAAPDLVSFLEGTDGAVAEHALYRLESFDAVPSLLDLLDSGDRTAGKRAIRLLVAMEACEAVPRILEIASDPAHPLHAVALREFYFESADVDRLAPFLRHPDLEIRRATLAGFWASGSSRQAREIVPLLGDPKLRNLAAEAIARMGPHAWVRELMVALRGDASPAAADLIDALAIAGDPRALPEILPYLTHLYSDLRRAAADAVGSLGDESHIPALVARLDDANPRVVEAAVRSLAKLGAEPEFLRRTNCHPDTRLALALLGQPLGWAELAPHFRNCWGCSESRPWTFESLVGRASLHALVPLLFRSRVRTSYLLRAIERTRDPECQALVRPYLEDGNESVRLAAASVLARWDASPAIRMAVDESMHPRIRAEAVRVVARGGDRRAPLLLRALRTDPDPRVRAAACVGRESAALLDDRDPRVRLAAARALARAGSSEGKALLVARGDPSLNWLRTPGPLRSPVTGGYALRKQHLERIESELKISFERPADLHFLREPLLLDDGALFDVLEQLCGRLYTFIVEKDRIRLLLREEAVEFWTSWR